MSAPGSPRGPPPQLRLNSGRGDLPTQSSFSNRRPGPQRQDSQGRSLIPSGSSRLTPGSSLRIETPAPGNYDAPDSTPPDTARSMEMLLPPPKSRLHRFRDQDSPRSGSPLASGVSASEMSSRRSSWSSEVDGKRRLFSKEYSSNPFADSRTPSRAGSDDEDINTQTVSEKYNILPSAGLLLYPEDVEKDDYLHNPDPNDVEKDCNVFTKRGALNVGGLVFITLGVLALFIGFPVATFLRRFIEPVDPCSGELDCLSSTVPLMKNVRTGLIDPDTPKAALTSTAADGTPYTLVFSDEFNTDGRTFYPGDDPYFTAVDIWYGVTGDLEWYDPDAVTTKDGVLEIRFDAFQNHGLNYRSGMVQSWNQLCFTGGRLEASISLPGAGDTIGFWPGFWAMGNLGRPGYAATTDGMWPYSYDDVCDAGITKNQSQTDGLNYSRGMRLPACTCENEDHPTPGRSRSAPEIDVIEASVGPLDALGNQVGVVSQSAQFAPFDLWYAADSDFIEMYDPSVTVMNAWRGGPYQEALSAVTNINNDWYDGKGYQKYAFEYTPGGQGKITWFVGDDKTWMMDARAVRPNGNVAQRTVPVEPMSVVMNFGMAPSFAFLNFTGINSHLPATMRFDYVRIYQPTGSTSVTCDPAGMETTEYIANHLDAYSNPNLTVWSETNYTWPKNALVDKCKAADTSVPITS